MPLPNGYFYIPGFDNRYAMKVVKSTSKLEPVVYSLVYPGRGGVPTVVGETSAFSDTISLAQRPGGWKILFSLNQLADRVSRSIEYITYLKNRGAVTTCDEKCNCKCSSGKVDARSGWIIGSMIADGTLSFSLAPKIHSTEASAYAESERLARASVGKVFVVFKMVRQVVAGGVQVTDL